MAAQLPGNPGTRLLARGHNRCSTRRVNSVDLSAAARDNRGYALCHLRDARCARNPPLLGDAPVIGDMTPVLWLCGPPGVGKTSVAWQIFSELAQGGVRVGYADIDQLGMCYPEPLADQGRHRMKAANLSALITNFRAAGARCVVVSGVVDPVVGVHAELLPGTALTICRLRAGQDEITRRLIRRHGPREVMPEALQEALAEADALDASDFADVCVDTGAGPAAEVAGLVRDSCREWAGFNPAVREPRAEAARCPAASAEDAVRSSRDAASADGHILLLCGVTGVGKSTIGFELYLRDLRADLTAAYIDLGQIGFLSPAPDGDPGNHRVRARNLASIWRAYHAAGASRLIAVGPVENEAAFRAYAEVLPAQTFTLCRLHAGPAELLERVISRGAGGSWPQPGDPLIGQPAAHLRQIAVQAAADAEALEHAPIRAVRIDTVGRTVAEAADLIVTATGWPSPAVWA
jgi:adenylylsulfate kinase-like enzyme